MKSTRIFVLFAFCIMAAGIVDIFAQPVSVQTINFKVKTYDDLELPARVLITGNNMKKMLLFINGSTPYDEKGNIGAFWNDKGEIIKEKQDFYLRFLDIMTSQGYSVATMAKRSFVYPTRLPRPCLADLALDIKYFIGNLIQSGLIEDEKDLVIVGYSEGSIVASKLLSMLKYQPAACILLGSATMNCNCGSESLDDFYLTDILRKQKNWNDDQIREEWQKLCSIEKDLLSMDEEKFETGYKNTRPYGFGFAMWESFYIDREVPLYDPVPGILYSNIPVLICVGEDDTAMPLSAARRTYQQLKKLGADKVFFHPVEKEVHQYKKYDVFAVMDQWLGSNYSSTRYSLGAIDSLLIEKYAGVNRLTGEIMAIPYKSGYRERALAAYAEADKISINDPGTWFVLGIKLFTNNCPDEAYGSFSRAADSSFAAYFAPLVWMGHIKDLNNQREEAKELYKRALDAYPGFPVQHDHWKIIIDKSWIAERLINPFKGVYPTK